MVASQIYQVHFSFSIGIIVGQACLVHCWLAKVCKIMLLFILMTIRTSKIRLQHYCSAQLDMPVDSRTHQLSH